MDAIIPDKSAGAGISENMKSGVVESANRQTDSQIISQDVFQMDYERLRQKISDIIYQLFESRQVEFDYEINYNNDKISIKLINKASGEIVREISVKPEFTMDRVKGIIYQIIA